MFAAGVVHLAALAVVGAASVPSALALVGMVRQAPRAEVDCYVLALGTYNLAAPVMILVNALAVAGYWAGLHRRSARLRFLVYAPTQASLMVAQYAVAVVLVLTGPRQISPISSVGLNPLTLFIMPAAYVVINLPLFLLLFPKIRRACFAA